MLHLRRLPVRTWRFLSRISIRLLAFNVLLVFLPAAGHLYLGTYERQLLEAQERAMVQQGRFLAAALGGNSTLKGEDATLFLMQLNQRFESRIRVVDRQGTVLADSSRMGPRSEVAGGAETPPAEVREHPLYGLGSLPIRLYRRFLSPPEPVLESGDIYSSAVRIDGPEIRAALDGRYGAATRVSSGGQRSVTLYSAIPIRSRGQVVGAVLVSQSTLRILQQLYEVRLAVFRVFLVSVAAAVVLTLLVSTTIARPLRRLRNEAKAILDRRGRLRRRFQGSSKLDEIGDLSRALEVLTRRLEDRMRFVESFASDVSHELKNPLASIRSATEMIGMVDAAQDRTRFARVIEGDVARMERLLSGIQRITHLDSELEEEERQPVDLCELSRGVVESFRRRCNSSVRIELAQPATPVYALARPEPLSQVIENVIENAVSFSPEGGEVAIAIAPGDPWTTITVEDEGPGVPEGNRDRIFDRFFSYRPAGSKDPIGHVGLGLSIAKAVVEGYGGAICAGDRSGGRHGARFEIKLPRSGRGA